MSKLKRNERIGLIVKLLVEHPNQLFTFSAFGELFDAAKSSISEDLTIVKKLFNGLECGAIKTISGAAGGVLYRPMMSRADKQALLKTLCDELMAGGRDIVGGFLYIADILYNPAYIRGIARVFAERFSEQRIDCVVTIETKGIPMAFMTAEQLNVPLVIVRKESKLTDGPLVSINYLSGTTGKLGQMYVHKRAIAAGARALIVDDVMKGGGTLKGLIDLVSEFNAEVAGTAVLIEMASAGDKVVGDTLSLLKLTHGEGGVIQITPNRDI